MLKSLNIESDLSMKIDRKICEIADCLVDCHVPDISLMGGKAGIALFWAYYSTYSKSFDLQKTLEPLIDDIFNRIRKGNITSTYAQGIAGVGWAIEHLDQHGFIELDTDFVIGSFDDYLLPYMLEYIYAGKYDYLHAAMGIGMYYLNRQSNSKTQSYLGQLIDVLEEKADITSVGIRWESNLSLLSHESGYNLGLSHGIASIIVILSKIYQKNICREKTAGLIEGAINYLLSNKRDPKDHPYSFPGWISTSGSTKGSFGRLSWCYYDLGISMALLQAGTILGKKKWKKEALNILLHTTEISDWNDAGVTDAGLCHGTAGIAHIYNRAYKYTGIERFEDSAKYWLKQSLNMAIHKDGLSGFKTYRTIERGGLESNHSFLEGIAGIGLALISAVSDIDPAWDGALLLS